MSEQKITQRKDSNKSITQKPLSEDSAEQISSSQLPPELPDLTNALTLRGQLVRRLQVHLGNSAAARRLSAAETSENPALHQAPPDFLRRDEGDEQAGEGNNGTTAAGAGAIHNAAEEFYAVSGATLNDLTGQLAHFAGLYGAQIVTHLGISTDQLPVERHADGSVGVGVPWSINCAVVGLPRWTEYAEACDAALQEWDRFMRKVRQHEQEAHVDMAPQFVGDLGAEDRVVTGANTGELRSNLASIQQGLRDRLQTLHDGCDHGVSIDAILHPDNGRCN
jgi:predicted secreted Zn-dependent protease